MFIHLISRSFNFDRNHKRTFNLFYATRSARSVLMVSNYRTLKTPVTPEASQTRCRHYLQSPQEHSGHVTHHGNTTLFEGSIIFGSLPIAGR